MAHKGLVVVLATIIVASAASATRPEPTPPTAPPGSEQTRYCMRVEPQTGSRIESIECWTREEWAAGGVDIDKDWPQNGVRVIA